MLTACSSDETVNNEEPLPEGMGRIRITICTPESNPNLTRAVNVIPWEDPDHDWEILQNFRVLICQPSTQTGKYVVKSVIDAGDWTTVAHTGEDNVEEPYSLSSTHKSAEVTSEPLPKGDYYIFAVANLSDYTNFAKGKTIDPEATVKYINGFSATANEEFEEGKVPFGAQANIPMTGKLTDTNGLKKITVKNAQETDAGTLTIWRVMAKMQFEFTNESDKDIKVIGIEVEPLNLASGDGPGIYLFSKDNLESIANLVPGATPPSGKEGITLPNGARTDVGTFRYQPESVPLTLKASGEKGSTGNIFFYVNESDATYTTTQNQLSLRFKVQRKMDDDTWYEQEIRYGVTTQWDETNGGGFNVIRRNDWIHIPIHLTDWQFSIEPLAFVPIAGYPAKTLSSDALTATFSTGGMIALQPFVKKYSDETWRSFGDPEITYGNEVKRDGVVNDEDSWEASITWKNADGDNSPSGAGKIVTTPFRYDPVTKSIIGELNNDLDASNYTVNGLSVFTKDGHKCFKTTFTVCLTLGEYTYSFTFNVILQK